MDNRIFNVNGRGVDMLKKALELAFMQEGQNTTCKAWKQTEKHGLILLWTDSVEGASDLPAGLDPSECALLVDKWLKSDFAKTVELSDFCDDQDHDGDNDKGWQVYCEDWGHVDNEHYAICAIKPAYLWMGK